MTGGLWENPVKNFSSGAILHSTKARRIQEITDPDEEESGLLAHEGAEGMFMLR